MRFVQLLLLVMSFSLLSSQALAEPMGSGSVMKADMSAEPKTNKTLSQRKHFFRKLMHVNFMPNLMPRLLGGYKHGNPLQLTKAQFNKLQKFHKEHSAKLKSMVNKVIKLEREARKQALAGKPDDEVLKVGRASLKIRAKIMQGKLKCRGFVRSVLTPEQFKSLTEHYHRPMVKRPQVN